MTAIPQQLATPVHLIRNDVNVVVDVEDGQVQSIRFDDDENFIEFVNNSLISLLVFHLKSRGGGEEQARFATHPLQFKGPDGQPIAVPGCLKVLRDHDQRCSVLVTNTVTQMEAFPFHAVVVFGRQLVGSPDPAIVVEPPPCSHDSCEEST